MMTSFGYACCGAMLTSKRPSATASSTSTSCPLTMSSFFNSSPTRLRKRSIAPLSGSRFNPSLVALGEHHASTDGAAQGGRSSTLGNLSYQFRNLQMQYSYVDLLSLCLSEADLFRCRNVSPIQRVITSEKGVILDFSSVSRDAKAQSKELYTWDKLSMKISKTVRHARFSNTSIVSHWLRSNRQIGLFELCPRIVVEHPRSEAGFSPGFS